MQYSVAVLGDFLYFPKGILAKGCFSPMPEGHYKKKRPRFSVIRDILGPNPPTVPFYLTRGAFSFEPAAGRAIEL
jgi:hypothetical protein